MASSTKTAENAATVADVFDDILDVVSPLFREETDLRALRAKVEYVRKNLPSDVQAIVRETIAEGKNSA